MNWELTRTPNLGVRGADGADTGGSDRCGREGLRGKWACAAAGCCLSLVLVRMAECVVPVRFRHRGGQYLPLGW